MTLPGLQGHCRHILWGRLKVRVCLQGLQQAGMLLRLPSLQLRTIQRHPPALNQAQWQGLC